MIGDTHTAALVGRNGSIDWLCLPRFDSGACFAALLGDETRGRWLLSPTGSFRTRRRYRADTLVLETEHETETGAVHVTDFMTPRRAQARVVRLVRGTRGVVSMHSELLLRFDYGLAVPWLRQGRRSVTAVAGPDAVHPPPRVRVARFVALRARSLGGPDELEPRPAHASHLRSPLLAERQA